MVMDGPVFISWLAMVTFSANIKFTTYTPMLCMDLWLKVKRTATRAIEPEKILGVRMATER